MKLKLIANTEVPANTCGADGCESGAYDCYDWSKGSKAVVASDGEHGTDGPLQRRVQRRCAGR